MATKAKPAIASGGRTAVARTAGLKPAISAAASKAAHAAAAVEFQAQKPKRARKATAAVGTGLPYQGQRGQLKSASALDELAHAPVDRAIAHVQTNGANLSEADIGRLVAAFQNATMPAGKVNESAKATTAKPSNPILAGLCELDSGITDLRSALQDLETAIGPVLASEILSDGEVGRDDIGDTESRVQREIRELRARIYYTTCWIKGITGRVEL